MKHKHGKWFADWRDEHGKRRTKAFPTKDEAKRYGKKMRLEAQRKKDQAARPSRKSSKRSAPTTPRAIRAAKPATA